MDVEKLTELKEVDNHLQTGQQNTERDQKLVLARTRSTDKLKASSQHCLNSAWCKVRVNQEEG